MLFCAPTGLPSPIITPNFSRSNISEPRCHRIQVLDNHSLTRLHSSHSLNMRVPAFAIFFIASVSLFSSEFFLCDLIDALTEFWQVLPMPRP
jgi:hypothetical protein